MVHLISRIQSGHTSRWFYPLIGSAFVSVFIFALFEQAWLAAVVAGLMVPVTIAMAYAVPRLNAAADTSSERHDQMGDA